MSSDLKNISNPYSTGGGGLLFENHVQSSFVVIMLSGGIIPCLPGKVINKIKLQCKYEGFNTDDLVAFTTDNITNKEHKLLAQIKHDVSVTKSNTTFQEVITAAWADYNNPTLFIKNRDIIVLVTGPLSKSDINDSRTILEWARHSENETEFIEYKVNLAKFSSNSKREKLETFRSALKEANSGVNVSNLDLFEFMKHFHIIGYDLDIKTGVTLSLLHSLISQFACNESQSIWSRITNEVQSFNQNAGTITKNSLTEGITNIFQREKIKSIPENYSKPEMKNDILINESPQNLDSLLIASILGGWDENNDADMKIIARIANGF